MVDHINHVQTKRGFTESFDDKTIETLIALGLIKHDHDGYVMVTGPDNEPYGPLHHFYVGND